MVMAERAVEKSEQEWREELTPEQYEVLRKAGTEAPFTGELVYNKDSGAYRCAACGTELFDSDTKFDSGTGWPSFTEPAVAEAVELRPDNSLFMRRTEVICRTCGGHLGHVFDDGPGPTGQRYCINSAALSFQPQAESQAQAGNAPAPEHATPDTAAP
jgi:peptide-methionine (R)-S-oxide reductase